MRSIKAIFVSFLFVYTVPSQAEIVTDSWLQQAGIVCGGGLNEEAQGKVGAAIFHRFKLANVSGDGLHQRSDVEDLLTQFQADEKHAVYSNYVECVLSLMQLASNASGLPPREIVLDSPISVALLETKGRGDRFVMAPGDTYAIRDHLVIFSIHRITTISNRGVAYFNWSNSSTGESKDTSVYQSGLIKIGEDCVLTPYKVDVEKQQVSLISNC